MGNPRIPRTLLAASLLALASCDIEDLDHGSGRFTEDFRQEQAMPPGGRLAVENVNGRVEIAGWDRNTIDVTGTKYAGSKEALAALKVDMRESAGVFEVRTVRPRTWMSRWNGGVRYRIRVPRKTRLDRIHSTNGSLSADSIDAPARLRTTNGSIKLFAVKGDTEAGSTNGRIELDQCEGTLTASTSNGSIAASGVRGRFIATTTNGSIDVTADQLDASASNRIQTTNGSIRLTLRSPKLNDIDASTTNGAITVHLPANADTRVRAVTSGGHISTDLPIADRIEAKGKKLEASLNRGGPLMDLRTSNGGIRIHKN